MTRQMKNTAEQADSIIISSYSGEPTKIRAPSHQSSSRWVTNLEGNMKQQKLDLLIYPAQPFKHWTEFYESNSAIQSTWSPRAFLYLIKKNIEFFGDAVVNIEMLSNCFILNQYGYSDFYFLSDAITNLTSKICNNLLLCWKDPAAPGFIHLSTVFPSTGTSLIADKNVIYAYNDSAPTVAGTHTNTTTLQNPNLASQLIQANSNVESIITELARDARPQANSTILIDLANATYISPTYGTDFDILNHSRS